MDNEKIIVSTFWFITVETFLTYIFLYLHPKTFQYQSFVTAYDSMQFKR